VAEHVLAILLALTDRYTLLAAVGSAHNVMGNRATYRLALIEAAFEQAVGDDQMTRYCFQRDGQRGASATLAAESQETAYRIWLGGANDKGQVVIVLPPNSYLLASGKKAKTGVAEVGEIKRLIEVHMLLAVRFKRNYQA
jgi:hypothetical protein